MSLALFDNHHPIERYDREELTREFAALASATAGKFFEQSLNWHITGSNVVVGDVFQRGFPVNLWIEHDWTVHTRLVVNLPSGLHYELRFNNTYGGSSGVPIIGPPRVESDLADQVVTRLLTERSYWQLVLAREPFALTLSKARLALATYRFYPHQFYLEAIDYLAEWAQRLESAAKTPLPVKPAVAPVTLPWMS